jgi:GntR family transcriptional regulator of vanillate catabolism
VRKFESRLAMRGNVTVLAAEGGESTRSEDATRRLRDMILHGDFSVNDRLQEIQLSAVLGVSRTPIRTALNTLHNEGLLDYTPKTGYRVRALTLAEILQAYSVRSVLEGLACRIVATAGLGEKAVRKFERMLGQYEQIMRKNSHSEFDRMGIAELNQQFHTLILQQAGNDMLSDFVQRALNVPLTTLRVIPHSGLQQQTALESCRQSHVEHLKVFNAITAREPEAAEGAMRAHVERAARLVEIYYRDAHGDER